MARKKLAPPTRRRRPGRGGRQVNVGWWATVFTIMALGVLGVVVSRGESALGEIARSVKVPELTAKTISVSKVDVAPFDRVEKGDVLIELTADGKATKITSPIDGVVTALGAAPNQKVKAGAEVARVQSGPDFAAGDHWHTAYGVNICGSWLPPVGQFESDFHTHGDGLLHIHPASTSAAGKNATLGLFFDRAGLEITANRLKYSDGETYKSGEVQCGEGKDKKDAVLRWALNGEEQEGNPANFVAGNGDVVAIAFLPAKADFTDTLPPSVSHMAESYVPPKHPDFQGTTTPTTFPTDAPADAAPEGAETGDPATTPTEGGETTDTTAATPTSGG
ncbi:MAG TPA: biotin/lipoyl-containing protein [Acidimicrobiia bacterium]|nr:biotin/lipoyl-containing protein [Acidimicrobiia bacterium]